MARSNAAHVRAEEISVEQQEKDAAAAYDAWFRADVEAGLREADDPKTVWHTQEEVEREFKELRKRWQARIDKGKSRD